MGHNPHESLKYLRTLPIPYAFATPLHGNVTLLLEVVGTLYIL